MKVGRWATVGATRVDIFTASIAGNFSNVMDYLQTLFGFFNAPLFATFILGMFWKRMTPTAGWSAIVVFVLNETDVIALPGVRGAISTDRGALDRRYRIWGTSRPAR